MVKQANKEVRNTQAKTKRKQNLSGGNKMTKPFTYDENGNATEETLVMLYGTTDTATIAAVDAHWDNWSESMIQAER
jgi:hypothetical protein